MDVDFIKLSPAEDDRTETMLLQMGKIPEFAAFYEDTVDTLMSEPNHVYDDVNSEWNSYYDIVTEHPHVNSSAFTNLQPPSAVSFSHQEPPALPLLQQQPNPGSGRWETGEYSGQVQKRNSVAAMREMIFQIAAMQPVHVDLESVKPPKRKNVKISTDPQSVAARHRRERISERIRILQRLVPGGTKMDTASMLDEAIHYMKFLKNQVQSLKRMAANGPAAAGMGFPVPMSGGNFHFAVDGKGYH